MAREARCLHECHIWVEDTPPVIAIQVQLDVNCVGNLSQVMKRLVSFTIKKKKEAKGWP